MSLPVQFLLKAVTKCSLLTCSNSVAVADLIQGRHRFVHWSILLCIFMKQHADCYSDPKYLTYKSSISALSTTSTYLYHDIFLLIWRAVYKIRLADFWLHLIERLVCINGNDEMKRQGPLWLLFLWQSPMVVWMCTVDTLIAVNPLCRPNRWNVTWSCVSCMFS